MKNLENKKGGMSILGIIILAVLLILVLSFFNVSLKAVVESPKAQDNFSYVGSSGRSLWNDYLKKPIKDVLDYAGVKYIWSSFVSNMQQIQEGKPTDFQKLAPNADFINK